MSREQDQALREVNRTEGAIAKGAAKGAKKLSKYIPLKVKVIIGISVFILLILTTLLSTLSIPQADKTFNITSQKEAFSFFNKPPKDEKKLALWDKDYTREQTLKYLEVISEFESSDKDSLKAEISNTCKEKGYDVEESLSHMVVEDGMEVNKTGSTGDAVIKTIDLKELDKSALTEFKVLNRVGLFLDTASILNNKTTTANEKGLYIHESSNGSDYVVAMPSTYGKNGSRYKAEFETGKMITLIKAKSSNKSKLITFIADFNKLDKKYADSEDVSNMFGKLKSLSMLESSKSKDTIEVTTLGESILAGFSIYMDNGQTIKSDEGKYVNQDEDAAQQDASKVNYTKHLKKILKEATAHGGHLYTIDYERDSNGNISVKSASKVVSTDGNETSAKQVLYVVPILKEMSTDEIAESIFELDPSAPYVNSGGLVKKDKDKKKYEENKEKAKKSRIDIRTAMDNIVQSTNAVIFDNESDPDDPNFPGTDSVISGNAGSGKYIWPTIQPTGMVPGDDSYFGWRKHPIYGDYRFHSGLDIAAPMHTQVCATAAGTVTTAGAYGGYGNCVIISHGKGMSSLYGHNDMVKVRVGQKVKQGQLIALSGSTGWSQGPHLHFEIMVNGTPVDPMKYLKKK